jgi:hypothetical protein
MTALATAAPYALPLAQLERAVKAAGYHRTHEYDVLAEMAYLVGKGLATEGNAELSAALKRWRVTASGTEYAEANALI